LHLVQNLNNFIPPFESPFLHPPNLDAMRRFGFFRQVLTLSASVLLVHAARAQADMTAGGGDASSGNHTLSFTLGQSFAHVHDDETGSVYQGVQQPYELFVVSLHRAADEALQVRLFPNPTAGWLLLELPPTELPADLRYVLHDMQGRPLDDRPVTGPMTEISLLHQPPGTYVLTLLQAERRVQSFQILKQ
jgi:hypothetical protein